MLLLPFMLGIVETKTAGRSRPWYRPEESWRSANGKPVVDDAWCDENQELRLVGAARVVPEKEADVGQFPEHRHPGDVRTVGLLVDAADPHGAAVLDQNFRLHVLGVDREAGRGRCAGRVVVDVER